MPIREPKNKDSFGYALFLVLGPDADRDTAAADLKIKPRMLLRYLRGDTLPSQKLIHDKDWLNTFANNPRYQIQWNDSKARRNDSKARKFFNKKFLQLRPREGQPPRRIKLKPIYQITKLGNIIQLICGGPNMHAAEVAVDLEMTHRNFSKILGGERVSQQYIKQHKFREVFAAKHHEKWIKYKARFEKIVAKLPEKSSKNRGRVRQPKDKDSFEWLIWRIAGGYRMNRRFVAKLLGFKNPLHLRYFFSGRQPLSQKAILARRWKKILKREFPEAWKEWGGLFDERLKLLRLHKGKIRGEIEDKDSFGYALYLVLGGENIDAPVAARRLKISERALNLYFQGGYISQDIARRRDWRKVFARYYAESWNENRIFFEEQFQELAFNRTEALIESNILRSLHEEKRGTVVRHPHRLMKHWRIAVAEIFQHVREMRGDDVEQVADAMEGHNIGYTNGKKEQLLKDIEAEKPVAPLMVRAAINELCRIYELADSLPMHYERLRKIGAGLRVAALA